jgi:hypothetical protein
MFAMGNSVASPELTWLPLFTNSAGAIVPVVFTDPQPATNAWRSYRLVPWR